MGGNLWGRVDVESQLGLAAVVDGQTFKDEKRAETGSSASSYSFEDNETLKTNSVVSKLTHGSRTRSTISFPPIV
jgi:hypothetical protein